MQLTAAEVVSHTLKQCSSVTMTALLTLKTVNKSLAHAGRCQLGVKQDNRPNFSASSCTGLLRHKHARVVSTQTLMSTLYKLKLSLLRSSPACYKVEQLARVCSSHSSDRQACTAVATLDYTHIHHRECSDWCTEEHGLDHGMFDPLLLIQSNQSGQSKVSRPLGTTLIWRSVPKAVPGGQEWS